jgi:hypothetical protein
MKGFEMSQKLKEDISAEMSLYEIVGFLVSRLGPTLVSALSGCTSRKESLRWAAGEESPTEDQEKKLLFGFEIWSQLSKSEGDDVSRLWFLGANPWLNEDSAISAIRESRFDEVRNAAQAMIDDTPGY